MIQQTNDQSIIPETYSDTSIACASLMTPWIPLLALSKSFCNLTNATRACWPSPLASAVVDRGYLTGFLWGMKPAIVIYSKVREWIPSALLNSLSNEPLIKFSMSFIDLTWLSRAFLSLFVTVLRRSVMIFCFSKCPLLYIGKVGYYEDNQTNRK